MIDHQQNLRKKSKRTLFGIAMAGFIVGFMSAMPANAELAQAACVPSEVATFWGGPDNPVNRVHVKCKSPVDDISYFAVSTDDGDNAARILSILTTAYTQGKAQGKRLSILYNPDDLSGDVIGCLNINCRLIGGVLLTDK